MHRLTRRQLIAGAAGLAAGRAFGANAPAAPVAIAKCGSYDKEMYNAMSRLMDQIGGLGGLVKGKTVAVKLNLTGNPERFPIRSECPYRNHPATVLALAQLLSNAGAQRIRILEGFFPPTQELELWARYGLDVKAISNVGCKVEWENTQNLGQSREYKRLKVPWGGYIFPAFDLNHSYTDCDVYVSLSKLKHHATAGVTMAMKNNFGNTPASLYGGDCGESGNENPRLERQMVCHNGSRTPPKGVPQELDMSTPRQGGYRVPRIVVDLVGARPIDLSIVDGIESIKGGEGEWNRGWAYVKPDLLLAGKNPVCVDAVSTALMGGDPQAERGASFFGDCGNMILLAQAAGIGTGDLARIELPGLKIKDAMFDYGPRPMAPQRGGGPPRPGQQPPARG
ncbi:MAG: DUF362 domain-containing protein [Bryobacterales bacterium]|nr:DUF362 domain-containing protein [Bryobacterales bacterium]